MTRIVRRIFDIKPIAAGAGLVVVALLSPPPAAAQNPNQGGQAFEARGGRPGPAAVGTCDPTRAKYKATELDGSSTTSTTFEDVPETAVPFTQGGADASCVIVHFSALAYARTTTMFVRARIGRIDAIPAVMQLTGDDDENLQGGAARARSVIFIFPSIAPGDHTVKIQYRSGQNGNRVWIHNHTTLVQFVP